jgi:DNA-binding response OmpR family regulator
VLLVEDDERLLAALSDVLRTHGILVDRAATARAALELVNTGTDAVVLDLGLPDRDGFDVCALIRQRSDVPILMATARSELADRVHGLNLGADDYLVKPYDVRELIARLHALARRRHAAPAAGPVVPSGSPVRFGEVTVDLDRRSVFRAGEPVALSRKEFDLLALLASSPGVVFRREQIISAVWQTTWKGSFRTLEVHVASVRAKTGVPGLIETSRGIGYRFGTLAEPGEP